MPKHSKEYPDIMQTVEAVGGWEEYYKQEQQSALTYWKELLTSGEYSDHYSPADIEHKIKSIEALFIVYQILQETGNDASFIGLTHTMQTYTSSVILPMKELLEAGKVEEAITLYKQPRRYHR